MKKFFARIDTKKWLYWFVLISLLASAVYSIINIVRAPAGAVAPENIHTLFKSDYTLMLIQCFIGIIVINIPLILAHRVHYEMPYKMNILYVIFLYCAIYLGEVRNFFYIVPHWDTVLHTFSGIMLGAAAFTIVNAFNDSQKINIDLSPAFVAIFALSFAIALGTIWEIYEFSIDGIFGVNMQKFALQDGTPLIGREALSDTMKDIIVDYLGALVVSIYGYFSMSKDRKWLKRFRMQRTKSANAQEE